MAAAAPPLILDEVLAIVRQRAGIDFTGYRRGTIERRLTTHLLAAGAPSGEGYLRRLRDGAGEVERLVARLTVKVSRFYRNPAVFDALRHRVLPDLRGRFPARTLRIWSAGCGQGEEAYSLAMLDAPAPALVWGSDVDEAALAVARAARYPASAAIELPADLAAAFVVPDAAGRSVRVVGAARSRVHFSPHDLTAEGGAPPGTRFHLVACRNVLIYLGQALQERVLRRLVESVVPGGVICLGEAEWIGTDTGGLEVLDRALKLFRRPEGSE